MAKRFYSERDIEDLVKNGAESLEVGEDTVLTELAYEKAKSLGLRLTRDLLAPPSAPVRPYLSSRPKEKPARNETLPFTPAAPAAPPAPASQPPAAAQPTNSLEDRIRSSVIARLGSQIDPVLLNTIISRVVKSVGGR